MREIADHGEAFKAMSKAFNYSLPHLHNSWGFISQKARETASQAGDLVSVVTEKSKSLPLDESWSFVSQKARETLIQASDLLSSMADKLKKESPSLPPPVMRSKEVVEDTVDEIKQYCFFYFIMLVVFLIFCKICICASPKKTMKAPGREHMMLRSDFEKGPRSYFHDSRAKNRKLK